MVPEQRGVTFWESSRYKEATTTETCTSIDQNCLPVEAKYLIAGSHIRPAPKISTCNPPSRPMSSACFGSFLILLSLTMSDVFPFFPWMAILANWSTMPARLSLLSAETWRKYTWFVNSVVACVEQKMELRTLKGICENRRFKMYVYCAPWRQESWEDFKGTSCHF